MDDSTRRAVAAVRFARQEEDRRHHTYDEELLQYEKMKEGDMEAIPMSIAMFRGNLLGKLSEDPVRNQKYLFVASITLACRFCIEGGMPAADAYDLSDAYIQRMDGCESVGAVHSLHTQMFTDYTRRMAEIRKEQVISKPILRAMDYVDSHLHAAMTLTEIAGAVELTPTYLSGLFTQEVGMPLFEYIRRERVRTAETLLKYSDYTCAEIAGYLAFSSHSHFNELFKKYTGMTPKAYRQDYFRHNWVEKKDPDAPDIVRGTV